MLDSREILLPIYNAALEHWVLLVVEVQRDQHLLCWQYDSLGTIPSTSLAEARTTMQGTMGIWESEVMAARRRER